MTNEEFTGHLMAALHGPKADEIAQRVGEIVAVRLGQPDAMATLTPAMTDLVLKTADALGINDISQMVQALTMLALATTRCGRRVGVTPADGLQRISARIAVEKVVQSKGREMYRDGRNLSEVKGGEFMASLFED